MIHFGEIPESKWVLHKCDNRRCVNPEHLFLGNAFLNNTDTLQKGRGNRAVGIKHGRSKLTEKDVLTIRREFRPRNPGEVQLAKRFGVCVATVHEIITRKIWRHI